MRNVAGVVVLWAILAGCESSGPEGKNPATAERASIDRFGSNAGIFYRGFVSDLPAPGEPVDFDRAPFLVHGLGPAGQEVTWYVWDALKDYPDMQYVLVNHGQPVPDQLPILHFIPNAGYYADLRWEVDVEVPDDYVANTITTWNELRASGYHETHDYQHLLDCPVVPEGSTARLRMPGDDGALHQAWYEGTVASYFCFAEAFAIDRTLGAPTVQASDLYHADGGDGSHDVVSTLPGDPGYSGLRSLHLYAGEAAAGVHDLATARAAPVLGPAEWMLNTPIVSY